MASTIKAHALCVLKNTLCATNLLTQTAPFLPGSTPQMEPTVSHLPVEETHKYIIHFLFVFQK